MENKITIPLFDLNYGAEEEQAVLETLRSKWISTGPKNKELETTFADMLGAKHSVALSSCTGSLHLAMRTLDIKEGDEVICPSLTFVATVNSIKFVGATPVFADITSMYDPTIDPEDVIRKITPKTKAVVVMHYAGFPCEMDAIREICVKNGLKLIEDACHAPLSKYKGETLGSLGDVSCYSFFSNKNISAGEGGMFVTNNPEYNEKARLLRSHGMTTLSYERAKGHSVGYDVVDAGYNYRMDDIRASLVLAQLSKIKEDIAARGKVRDAYIKHLSGIEGLTIPFKEHEEYSSNYIFPLVLEDNEAISRDQLREELLKRGIQTSVHYPPVHKFRIYEEYKADLPKTERFAANEVTLPLYASLSEENVKYICQSIKEILAVKPVKQTAKV